MEKRLMCVVIRHHNDTEGHEEARQDHEEAHGGSCESPKYDLPYEKAANTFMSAKGYFEYVKKHGYHFTDALAEHVSRMMVNASGQQHSWTTAQVKKAMEGLGLGIPEKVTDGDVAYAANMAFADFYPDPLKDEASCLRYAHKLANDPDGYEGMIFTRWVSDAIGKGVNIAWEKFIG